MRLLKLFQRKKETTERIYLLLLFESSDRSG